MHKLEGELSEEGEGENGASADNSCTICPLSKRAQTYTCENRALAHADVSPTMCPPSGVLTQAAVYAGHKISYPCRELGPF